MADPIRGKVPKLAAMMDEAETDVLACMNFPVAHRPKLHSTNPIERLNGKIKRRTDVVGIFPKEKAILRWVGAILLEQNDESMVTLPTMAASAHSKPCLPKRTWANAVTPPPGIRPSSEYGPITQPNPPPVSITAKIGRGDNCADTGGTIDLKVISDNLSLGGNPYYGM